MICPYCKKEEFLVRAVFDPSLFGCSKCRSSYSETFLQAWNIGFIEGQAQPKDSADKKSQFNKNVPNVELMNSDTEFDKRFDR
jgi:hypothetical protein